jgi:hypothetical protein
VSISPSTTCPFDAPEFILTQRHRHPARRHCFCPRVLYSLNPPFWPISGTLQLLVSWCYIGLTCRKRGQGIGFISVSKGCCALCEDLSRFFLSFIPYSLVAILSCLPHQGPTRSVVRKLSLVGVSVSEPIGPSVDVHPAETDPVPPEQLPLLGALPDPAPMQSLVSPFEVSRPEFGNQRRCFLICLLTRRHSNLVSPIWSPYCRKHNARSSRSFKP